MGFSSCVLVYGSLVNSLSLLCFYKLIYAFRFEDLKAWQNALQLSNEIDFIARSFPRIEMFSLALQIKKAADSVILNIAEGSTGQSIPEYKRF